MYRTLRPTEKYYRRQRLFIATVKRCAIGFIASTVIKAGSAPLPVLYRKGRETLDFAVKVQCA